MTMEQVAKAAEEAAAARLAARIAAARLATTRGLGGAAGFDGAAARLRSTAGLDGTTAAGFAAAIVIALEQAEQAATTVAARITTTGRFTTGTVPAKEGRSTVGTAEHHQGAQDQRRKSKTSVHLETPKETETGGEHTLSTTRCELARRWTGHLVGTDSPPDVGSPHHRRTT